VKGGFLWGEEGKGLPCSEGRKRRPPTQKIEGRVFFSQPSTPLLLHHHQHNAVSRRPSLLNSTLHSFIHSFVPSFVRSFTLFCLVVAHLSTRPTLVVYLTPSTISKQRQLFALFWPYIYQTIHLRYSLTRYKAIPQFKRISRILRTLQGIQTQLYPHRLIGRKISIPRRNVFRSRTPASCAPTFFMA
jgi:hypothetical protein